MEQIAYRGAAQSVGFNPVTPTSPTALIAKNQQGQLESLDNALAMERANLEAVGRIAMNNRASDISQLTQFSQTLGEMLVKETERRNESDMEEGLMMAFTEGVSQEEMDHFNAQEAKLNEADAAVRTIAGKVEQEGGSPFVANKFRELSGWKEYGYAKGLAMKGGTNYPLFYAQEASNTSVVINGQEVTLDNAKTPAERAAVESQIRRKYLRQYAGINPALLNKYLFPSMMEHENRQAVEWGERIAGIQIEERKAEAQDSLFTAINAGQGGQAVIDFVNQRAGDFGGIGNARKIAADMLREGVKNRIFNQQEIDAILNHEFTARDGSRVRLGDYWGRDFGDLPDLLYEAGRVDLQRELQQQEDAKKQFELLFEQQTAQRNGKPWTDAELKAIADNWESQGLGPAPDFLKDYQSREERDADEDKTRLLRTRQSRGYLTEEDLRGVSPETYQQFIGYVRDDEDLAKPDEAVAKDANSLIQAMVTERFASERGQTDKSTDWQRTKIDAIAGYARYYRENIRNGMTPEQANKAALQRVEANIKAGSYGQNLPASSNQQAQANLSKARKALAANTNLVNTGVIPGTEAALQQAKQYAETGRGEIPLIYKQLASHHRGLTGWDIANAQLQAAGLGGLMKPRVEQAVDQMDPTLRPLLTWRPTAARANRVALATGWKPFLDLITSQESSGYGEYDAMNSGGSHGGTVAYGSANSVNVFGRGLSSMTIGEVRRLQAEGKVHAAGRYQIIGSTLNELMTKYRSLHGFDDNTPYNAATQDALAVVLAQRRLRESNKLTALRNEWVGLRKVSDGILQNAINNITVQSPFNQPHNLLPRLVYRVGSRGYGSTGPHLDVKPVVAGDTQTSSELPAMTATELDQYVVVGSKQRPLSQGTTTTDDDRAHRNRGSFGHDFAAPDGTPVYLKNGAQVVGSFKGDEGTDHLIIQLPDGRRYQLLHGLKA